MLYLANASSPAIRNAIICGELGQLCTPAEARRPLANAVWAADNGCFGRGYPGDRPWLAWLQRHVDHVGRCLWATAPDVVGDAAATLDRSWPWLPVIRDLGYRAALVAQDGLERLPVPWHAFDALFLGGSTQWKLGPHAALLAREAQQRGLPVHMGRVNSFKRFAYAAQLGCTSADGTCLTYGPDRNLRRLQDWTRWAAV